MIKQTVHIIGLISFIFLMSCSGNNEGKSNIDTTNKANKSFLESVKTVKSEYSNLNQELILNGKVEYDPDKVINYVSLVNGIADRTYFSLGDKVNKGQVLLDIRSAELSALQSESVIAESEVKIAEREYQTADNLFEDNMISEKELLEAQAKLNQARATVNKIKNDIEVHGLSRGNGTFSIKSPMSGYVVGKNVSSGSTISSEGEPLFTVADLTTVWITANVYASNLQFVKQGMEVFITTLSYPGEVFSGKINTLSQVFDPEEKVLKARIVMNNKNLKFKPEMSVVVKLKDKADTKFISIPSDALIFDDNRYFVVVEESSGNFKVKEVVLKGHYNKISYLASGLSEGESVVVNNQLLIYAGLKEY